MDKGARLGRSEAARGIGHPKLDLRKRPFAENGDHSPEAGSGANIHREAMANPCPAIATVKGFP